MDGITFGLVWLLSSFPIVRHVNRRMEEMDDVVRYKTSFQIFLFIRAQFEVPRFYLIKIINLLK